jgi:glucose/arabinose dehydrogenase
VIDDIDTPLGLVWLDDALYVARRSGVERYARFDGTSFAEHHAVLTLPDGVGTVHGLATSSDGYFVVGVAAPCDSCTPTSPWSATVVTFRADGSDARVYASGIRAAVGLAYFPGTDDLFASVNQRDDLGARTPGDWLAVLADGQNWGFPKCYGQGSRSCADVPDPVAVLDEHAAVSGVAMLGGQLGTRIGTGAVVAEWMTGKVKFVSLTKKGADYRGTVEQLLSGFSRPMPVLATRDGALLVGDWGTGRIVRVAAAS